ncbi:E3 ubiquitin-protein ligase Midline-1-like [Boleophthalmus pectinirostris]|uniref:E3 ubiquitin-protein ligase Midline-1-like n=1 Tax=Boleophthalmus pectinirostris TaxID=150288 RepID=UPI00243146F3|nr:E3 ubiquitin-protein ligase Midline-1-like [Boleophthalmus pectinirostris]
MDKDPNSRISMDDIKQHPWLSEDLSGNAIEVSSEEHTGVPVSMEVSMTNRRLSGCLVSERGGAALASALSSAPSHLRELDLSYNHPGPSAQLLTTLQDQRLLLSVRLDPAGEQWMIPGLKKYSCVFSLDPNTAHRELALSEDNCTVTRLKEEQLCPHHEDRFKDQPQVLSSTGLRGRCYWEVEWSGSVDIAVTNRTGESTECRFGDSDQSWSLRVLGGTLQVCQNGRKTSLSPQWFLPFVPVQGQVIDFKVLLLVYKALNGLSPIYLSDLLLSYEPLGLSGPQVVSF